MSLRSTIQNWVSRVSNFLEHNVGKPTVVGWAVISTASALALTLGWPAAVGWLAATGLYNLGIPTMMVGWIAWLTGKIWNMISNTQSSLAKLFS